MEKNNKNNTARSQQRPGRFNRPPGFGNPRFHNRSQMRLDTPNQEEFFEKVVQVNRVSKKTPGGDKRSLSVLVVVGDRKGKVGVGLGKASDVQSSVKKATAYAKKHFIDVPLKGRTIPHPIFVKMGAAKVLLKPASVGTGVIAGGAVRVVVEAAGIHDVVSKILGTKNQASNVYATLEALRRLKRVNQSSVVRESVIEKQITEKSKSENRKPKTDKSKTGVKS